MLPSSLRSGRPDACSANETRRRGRHAAPRRLSGRSRIALPILAAGLALTGGVAIAAPLAASINYKVAAPITVQALGISNATPSVNTTVTAGAKVVAERDQVLDYAVLVVRDQAGRNYDFPPAKSWAIGTTQKEFTASRTFDRPGTYTYWFGYLKGSAWTNLTPQQTFTVGGTPAANPSPSATATSPTSTPSPTATATTSPTPTTSTTSTTPPSSGGRACPAWPATPNGSCTGVPAGTTLRTCSTTLSTPGATYDGCLFTGQVSVQASNITIKNSKVVGRVNAGYGSQTGLVLTDVEIDGQRRDQSNQSAIGDQNYTCIRCNVHDTGRGAAMGRNVVIRDSWFHDFYYTSGAHQTAVQSNGGSNFRVEHNTLTCNSGGCSAALSFYGDFAPIKDVVVKNNLLNTTGSYCTYGGSVSGKPYPTASNVQYLDNRFGKVYYPRCGIYGPVSAWAGGNGNVWSGNAWADGSGPVNP